ncbi:MAG: adenylyltransferase/cytidyltransferase family protein, partial [Holdemanella sp.]|nr:adenylyltransferase/cytidyltransferase family protein [Holdemanella sp.]
MQVIQISLHDIPILHNDVCACIGYFDGIHKGHQQLIHKCMEISKEKHIKSSMITFDPDPYALFHPELKIEHITPLKDRIELAKAFGMDYVYILNFSKEMASLDVQSFHTLLNDLKVMHLVCGFDFKYASKNSGNIETLKNQSFGLTIIDSINDEYAKISSSRIEPIIKEGNILKANQLLGYIYSISGIVVHGFKRGTTILQVPTANLSYTDEYVLPKVK